MYSNTHRLYLPKKFMQTVQYMQRLRPSKMTLDLHITEKLLKSPVSRYDTPSFSLTAPDARLKSLFNPLFKNPFILGVNSSLTHSQPNLTKTQLSQTVSEDFCDSPVCSENAHFGFLCKSMICGVWGYDWTVAQAYSYDFELDEVYLKFNKLMSTLGGLLMDMDEFADLVESRYGDKPYKDKLLQMHARYRGRSPTTNSHRYTQADPEPLFGWLSRCNLEPYMASLGTTAFPFLFPRRWRQLARKVNDSPNLRHHFSRMLSQAHGLERPQSFIGEYTIYLSWCLSVGIYSFVASNAHLFIEGQMRDMWAHRQGAGDEVPAFLKPLFMTLMGGSTMSGVVITGRMFMYYYLLVTSFANRRFVDFSMNFSLLLTDVGIMCYVSTLFNAPRKVDDTGDDASVRIHKLIEDSFNEGCEEVAQGEESASARFKLPLLAKLMELFTFSCLQPYLEGLPQGFISMCLGVKKHLFNFDSAVGFFQACTEFIRFFIERCKAFHASGNWKDLFGEDLLILKDISDGIFNELVGDKTKLIADGGLRLIQIKKTVRMLTSRLKEKSVCDQPAVKESILKVIRQLDLFDKSMNSTRKPPVSFVFHGPSGCGKTFMIEEIAHLVKAQFEIAPETGIVFYKQDTKHQIIPSYSMIVAVNDYFTTKESESAVSNIALMQQYSDSAPMREETASLEEKANSIIAPEFVIFTTNTDRYNSSRATCGANKLNRRYQIASFSFTNKAFELAKEKKIDVEQLLTALGPQVAREQYDDLVQIKIYWMQNKNDNWINFVEGEKQDGRILTPKEFVHYAYNHWRERCKVFETVNMVTRCAHGISLPCPLCVSVTVPQSLSPEELHSLSREALETFAIEYANVCETDYSHAKWRVDHFKELLAAELGKRRWFEGFRVRDWCSNLFKGLASVVPTSFPRLRIKIGNLVDTNAMIDDVISDYFETRFGVPRWVRPYFSRLSTITLGVAGVSSLLCFVAWYNREKGLEPQGNVLPPIPQLPNERTALPPTDKFAQVPWLANPSNTPLLSLDKCVVKIGNEKITSHALIVGCNGLLVNKHIFEKLYSTQNTWIKEGEMFTVLGNKFSFDPESIAEVSYDCVLLILPLKGVFTDCFDDLSASEFSGSNTGFLKKKQLVIQKSSQSERLVYANPGTEYGDCGNPLIVDGKICGIHCSLTPGMFGYSPYGSSSIITQERVLKARDVLEKRGRPFLRCDQDVKLLTEMCQSLLDPSKGPKTDLSWLLKKDPNALERKGEILLGVQPSCDKPKMTCHKTTIYDHFARHLETSYHAPTVRHAVKIVAEDGSVSYKSPIVTRFEVDPPEEIFLQPWLKLNEKLVEAIPKPAFPLAPLTPLQALVGEPGQPYIGAVDCSKSPGPLSHIRGISKEESIYVENGVTKINALTLTRWFDIIDRVKRGFSPLLLTKAVAKDACTTKEHIDVNKYRLFFVCEQQFNWTLKIWLGPLLSHIYANRFETSVFAGMNPGSKREWTALINFLSSVTDPNSPNFTDLDQKAFDVHHDTYVFHSAAHYMYLLAKKCGYSDSNAAICARLVISCGRYVLVIEGNVILTSSKLPSGEFVTLWINSYATRNLFSLYADEVGCDESDYRIASVGDDLFGGVSDKLRSRFNAEEYVLSMKRKGYDVQSADKGKPISLKPLTECIFLQRHSVLRDGIWYAPIKKESIFKSLCYCVGKFDEEQQKQRDLSTLRCAFGEAFLHGEEFYNLFSENIRGTNLMEIPPFDLYEEKYLKDELVLWSPLIMECCGGGNDLVESSISSKMELRGVQFPQFLDRSGNVQNYPSHPAFRDVKLREAFSQDSYTSPLTKREEGSCDRILVNHAVEDRVVLYLVNSLTETLNTHIIPKTDSKMENFTELQVAISESDFIPSTKYNLPNPQRPFSVDFPYKMKRNIASLTISTSSVTSSSFYLQTALDASTDPLFNNLLNAPQLVRFDSKITFAYTGNSAAQGMVRISFVPVYNQLNTTYARTWIPSVITNVTAAANLPHFDLDLSTTTDRSFSLPFSSEFDFNNTQSGQQGTWMINALEVCPFISATGAVLSDMEIQIYFEAFNIELLEYAQSGEGEEKWSSWLKRMGKYAGMIPTAYTTIASQLLGTAGDLAAFMGYGRSYKQYPEVFLTKQKPNWSLGSGPPDGCELVGTNSEVCSNIDFRQYPMGRDDDMSTLACLKRFGQVSMFTLSTSATSVIVAPGVGLAGLSAAATVAPIPLNYFGMMFKFWRGSIKVRICLCSSPLLRGKMIVNVVPPNFSPPASPVTNGKMPFYELDFCGSSELEIVVPYVPLNGEPFSEFAFAATNGVADVTYSKVVFFLSGNMMGSVAAPSSPYVNVYMAAGDDFEVAVPTTKFMDSFTIAQSGPGIFQRSQQVFGESFHSLGTICKKPTVVYVLTQNNVTQTSGSLTVPMEHLGIVPATLLTQSAYTIALSSWSYYAWVIKAFIGSNGGFCWRFVSGTGNQNSVQRTASFQTKAFPGAFPGAFVTTLPTGAGTGICASQSEATDVCFPAENNANYRPARVGNQFVSPTSVKCLALSPMATTIQTTGTTTTWLLFSAMDDLSFGGFLGPPMLTARVAT